MSIAMLSRPQAAEMRVVAAFGSTFFAQTIQIEQFRGHHNLMFIVDSLLSLGAQDDSEDGSMCKQVASNKKKKGNAGESRARNVCCQGSRIGDRTVSSARIKSK